MVHRCFEIERKSVSGWTDSVGTSDVAERFGNVVLNVSQLLFINVDQK